MSNRRLTIVQELIRAGATVDLAIEDGTNPLLLAAENGYPEIVRCLVESGANLSVTHGGGESAVSKAAWGGNGPIGSATEGHVKVLSSLIYFVDIPR